MHSPCKRCQIGDSSLANDDDGNNWWHSWYEYAAAIGYTVFLPWIIGVVGQGSLTKFQPTTLTTRDYQQQLQDLALKDILTVSFSKYVSFITQVCKRLGLPWGVDLLQRIVLVLEKVAAWEWYCWQVPRSKQVVFVLIDTKGICAVCKVLLMGVGWHWSRHEWKRQRL